MAGDIISYIAAYGHLSFNDVDFNEVDSLILCQLAYLYFDDCQLGHDGRTATMAEILQDTFSDRFVEQVRAAAKNITLFKAAAASRRFGTLTVMYYENNLDEDNQKQFSAITFRLAAKLHYLAYRGTDATFVGWKEDFNLSFLPSIPSHSDAAAYFSFVASKIDGEYILGGHSKGGNLAVYAAITAPGKLQDKIIAIYDHDGPGFLPEVFQRDDYKHISSRIYKTIPQTAVFGLLLEQHASYSVVASDAFVIMQHDPFSWQVENGSFIHLETIDSFSKYTNEALNAWIATLDYETRQQFTDSIYAIIQATEAATYYDLFENWRVNIKTLIKSIKTTDPAIKKLITKTIHALLNAYFDEMRDLIGSNIFKHKDKQKKLPGPSQKSNSEYK